MKHPSAYLDWYVHVPSVKFDFRSSGLAYFKYDLNLGEVDLSLNYAHGNPKITELLAKRYNVQSENVFVSSEGASGQNARIIRYLAERNRKRSEAIVEYPTYEPLLRQVQEHFPHVKRLQRKEEEGYRLDVDALRKMVSEKTGLLLITNPHAPSGAVSDRNELKEVMDIANEHDFFVVCDEIYAEFDRGSVPSVFSVDEEHGIVTSSFTKAYGLGGLKLGTALANRKLVDELYVDVLNTVGNSPNIVQLIAANLLGRDKERLIEHKRKWVKMKSEAEKLMKEYDLEYFPNKISVTYWLKTPVSDTYKWTNDKAIPKYSLAAVPGAFFLFRTDCKIEKTEKMRLGLGNINPSNSNLAKAFETLMKALK
jgi:aspartate/methionine/tyrosine aminotransferase